MVSQELTKELQQILREEYGSDLSVEEVSRTARELTDTFDLLAQINHKNTIYQNKMKND